jgi:tetratricopeptide (TPR) repeat protein
MRKTLILVLFLTFSLLAVSTPAQSDLTPEQEKAVQEAFDKANSFMEKENFSEALKFYKQALSILPNDPSLLYNGGMSAFQVKEMNTALDLWSRLKKVDAEDWMVRAKLIQTYQALDKIAERDRERTELFELRKSKKVKELNEAVVYCREQFQVNGYKIMVLEHFELEGDRALRYAFMVSKPDKSEDDFKITLGSYDMTNAVWRETTKPAPKEGQRLFHIDGYYKWGHSTIGMYTPEPSYEETRAIVVKVLEGKQKPVSSSTVVKSK